MQRLTGEVPMSRSYAGAGIGYGSNSQDTRIRTIYATTPSKRKRIFEWSFYTFLEDYNMEEGKKNKENKLPPAIATRLL